jgi:hypothetical protein
MRFWFREITYEHLSMVSLALISTILKVGSGAFSLYNFIQVVRPKFVLGI